MAYDKQNYLERYWRQNQHRVEKLTSNTITRIEDMQLELEKIREWGFAMDDEENEFGVTCIACPIFDIQGKVNYSVSISLSTARLQLIGRDTLLEQIRQAANGISLELGADINNRVAANDKG